MLPPAVRLAGVAADVHLLEVEQRLLAVVPLVDHRLAHEVVADLVRHALVVRHRPQVLRRSPRSCRSASRCRRRPRRTRSPPGSRRARPRPGPPRARPCGPGACVPSFIFVIFASGSCGFCQSSLLALFFRFLSSFARSSRVGVSMPLSLASRSGTPGTPRRCRAARWSAWRRWPPAWWSRRRRSCPRSGRGWPAPSGRTGRPPRASPGRSACACGEIVEWSGAGSSIGDAEEQP